MLDVAAYAAPSATGPLEKTTITRRDLRPQDVLIEIAWAGICHSDIHTARGEWGRVSYPLVPGHEITGHVAAVGPEVTRFHEGDRVGVGCFVDSCRECSSCAAGEEQYCDSGPTGTYGDTDRKGEATQGGYSTHIVVDERFVVRIPENLDMAAATPLLCAGITTYSPLRNWGVGPGSKVGVIGVGGLGHVAVKIAAAMGAEVTAFGHSEAKREDALRFGASAFVSTADPESLRPHRDRFDLILNTVSVNLDLDAFMRLLALDGTLVELGLPTQPLQVRAGFLTGKRRSIAGSLVGGLPETQEMLDFCAEHGITAEIETIAADRINEAYERVVASDVRYRFVIDAATI